MGRRDDDRMWCEVCGGEVDPDDYAGPADAPTHTGGCARQAQAAVDAGYW